MQIDMVDIDYRNPVHASILIELLDAYAKDPMGGGHALSEHARQHLAAALARRPDAFSVLAYGDGMPAGLVNCFEGFSTFACRPLVNIHDLVVLPPYRGQGVALHLLRHVERIAAARGCCKLTLEVLEGNESAQRLYRKFGFAGYSLGAENGDAMFLQKTLEESGASDKQNVHI